MPITVADDFDVPATELWQACEVAEKAGTYGASKKRAVQAKRKGK